LKITDLSVGFELLSRSEAILERESDLRERERWKKRFYSGNG